MPYTPYYAAWKDAPSTDTPIISAALKNMEDGIAAATTTAEGAIPKTISGVAADKVPVYDGAAWVAQKIVNAQIDAGAAIAKSKLAALNIVNADVDAAAAIAVSKLSAPWTSYTPTWGSTSTVPSLGDGTLTGKYLQIGKIVFFKIRLTMGGTTTYGAAAWRFSLPVAAAAGSPQNGDVRAVDASASAAYHQAAFVDSTNGVIPTTLASPVTYYDGTVPFAWASGDTLDLNGFYEAS